VFAMQLSGRGKTPEEREKILRKLSGIKETPKKKEKEKKAGKGAAKHHAAAAGAAAKATNSGPAKTAQKAEPEDLTARSKHGAKAGSGVEQGRSVAAKKSSGRK